MRKHYKKTKQNKKNIQKNIQKQTLLHVMAMVSKILLTEINEDDTIRIVLLVNFETPSYIKGYHEYQKIWTPVLQEDLCGEMEPAKPLDKYAVAIKKNNVLVGHLPLGYSGKFAKTVFYFVRAGEWSECNVIVAGKPVNRGDGDGMEVPCLLKFHGQKSLIGILKQQLHVMK